MRVLDTAIADVRIIEPQVFGDARGFFFESFNLREFRTATGLDDVQFVQDNHSRSAQGVLRGLHYQITHPQGKLVRVISGAVFDVAVDIRKGSPTYGKHVAVELSEENHRQFFVPRGFAHGFAVLSEIAVFQYKCDNFYNKESEGGLIYNDQTVNINWNFPLNELIISDKDQILPNLENTKKVW